MQANNSKCVSLPHNITFSLYFFIYTEFLLLTYLHRAVLPCEDNVNYKEQTIVTFASIFTSASEERQ